MYLVLLAETLFLSLPLPMLTVYLLHCCGESIGSSRLLHTVAGLWAVFFVLLAGAPFLGITSYFQPDKYYYRGPLYPLLLLPMIGILLLNLAGAIQRRKHFSRKTFLSFLAAILPMTFALIVMLFVDFLPIFDISFVISAIAMYGLILSDRIEQDLHHQREIARQQQEIANQRASIMVLQMRPHFIYNTMTSIYCLCDQDPKLARQVVMDFTTYLRKNFTAIASSAPIPFSSELEHIRAYLAVEQALYEDSLFVKYDTPHTRFRVPPLTLQPIVENAVKHGMDPEYGPLRISIRTRETRAGSEITVEDSGPGFAPAADNSEPHIALENIRQRLGMMCGGKMTIRPRAGGGTVVTVTIPPAAKQDE
jgi:sensor histidine kinase YesM